MASPSTVITLGYGSFGSVNLVPTLGYGIASVVVVSAASFRRLQGPDNTFHILRGPDAGFRRLQGPDDTFHTVSGGGGE